MDDSIKANLVAQNHHVADLEASHQGATGAIDRNDSDLGDLRARSAALRERLGIPAPIDAPPSEALSCSSKLAIAEAPAPALHDYSEITAANRDYLVRRELSGETLDEQFTRAQLESIERALCAPVPRLPWDRWDCCAVLAAGIGGVAADFFTVSNDQHLKEWLSDYKIESPKVATDYQGPGFGGPYHRGLSPGHDILRVFEAVWQIKNGTFRGLKQTPGGFAWVQTPFNQHGHPYDTFEAVEALLIWLRHLVSDFVTAHSLPFPGMSFLLEVPDHEVRKLAIQLYQSGLNLRFIFAQALAPALVELIVRAYFLGREYRENGSIQLDESKRAKQTELLLASHAMVVAVNAGRVAVQCHAEGPTALRHLNVPAIIATVRRLVPFVAARLRARDPVEILRRNARVIVEGYDSTIGSLRQDLERDTEFQRFLLSSEVLRV